MARCKRKWAGNTRIACKWSKSMDIRAGRKCKENVFFFLFLARPRLDWLSLTLKKEMSWMLSFQSFLKSTKTISFGKFPINFVSYDNVLNRCLQNMLWNLNFNYVLLLCRKKEKEDTVPLDSPEVGAGLPIGQKRFLAKKQKKKNTMGEIGHLIWADSSWKLSFSLSLWFEGGKWEKKERKRCASVVSGTCSGTAGNWRAITSSSEHRQSTSMATSSTSCAITRVEEEVTAH